MRSASVTRSVVGAGVINDVTKYAAELARTPYLWLATDYRRARLIRRRYTILDCLEDLGWLQRGIDALFAPDGFSERRLRGRL